MRKLIWLSVLAMGLQACSQPPAESTAQTVPECKVGSYAQADILVLKAQKFAGLEEAEVNQIALDMLPCLGHPESVIRDGLVYESFSSFLRGGQITDATKLQMFGHVLAVLSGPATDDGYIRPFAALNIAELARADRIKAYLSDTQREDLVQSTANYMKGITDYRGFVDGHGWRHGVAHTADLILQLSLNANVTDTQLRTLQTALGTQIAPASGHAYIHGESERMARAVLYMANRGSISAEEWDVWFGKLADPAPLQSWSDAYKSEAGIAKLHNTKAFLSTVYINAAETKNENIKALLAPARAALIKLP